MTRNVFTAAAVIALFLGFINLSVEAINCTNTQSHIRTDPSVDIEFICNTTETDLGVVTPDNLQQIDISWALLSADKGKVVESVWVGLYSADHTGISEFLNDAFITSQFPTSLTFNNFNELGQTIPYETDMWYKVVVAQEYETKDEDTGEVHIHVDYDFDKYWVGNWLLRLLSEKRSDTLAQELNWVDDYLERYDGDRTEDRNWTNPAVPDAPAKQRRLTTTWASLKKAR